MMVSREKVCRSRKAKLKSDKRLSKVGYEFDVYQSVWRLTASKTLNTSLLAPLNLSPEFEESFLLVLADYACEFSSGYTSKTFTLCRKLFESGVSEKIEERHIANYKASLTKTQEHKLGSVRAFILDWYDKEIQGVSKKAVDLLKVLKLSGEEKGKAVATGCPHSGAYSFDEQVAFINWYVDAYTEKLISLRDYAFIMILQSTGARPIQVSYLYSGDLITRMKSGITCFDLRLPNAKKRKENIRDSYQLKEDVSEDLALVLNAQIKQSIQLVEAYFDIDLDAESKNQVPIFVNESKLSESRNFREFLQVTNSTPDYFCITKGQIGSLIQRIARLCPLKTQRIMIDGEAGDLHINPRRFRYTHATNMAIVGASAHAIAEELGHEDTQHVTVYTEFKEEMAERIDEALAPSLIPLSQAFLGTLIDSDKDAVRANDPRSLINTNKGDSVGNCGEFGFCANGTVHCYTCNKFQPWVNGPHHQVLDKVISERDWKLKMGASEFVLQGHNRSIDAIRVVIKKCEVRKQELEKEVAINA
jgi:hypothetical protein